MKLFGFRRKPEWQHADAKRRLAAVETLQDPELKAALPALAQSDPDPKVRIAAIARIDDLAVLERRMRGEHDGAVAAAAKQRLIQRMCAAQADIAVAQEALRQVHDEDVLTEVAEHAAQPALRRLAIERSQRSNLKLQRCIHDADPELRLWLLSQIDDADALQRIAESVRKKDKRLARAARDKLDALKLAAGDPATLEARALSLSEVAGRLARELPADREQTLQALQGEWQALRDRVSEATRRRVQGAVDTADLALRAARGDWTPPAPAAPPAEAISDAPPADEPMPAVVTELRAGLPEPQQPDFDARVAELRQQIESLKASTGDEIGAPAKREIDAVGELLQQRVRQRNDWLKGERQASKQAEREAQLATLEQHLAHVEQALQSGQAQQAQEAWQAITELGKLREMPSGLRRRWQECQHKLNKLTQAQRWASRQARQRLCEDAEALQGSGLHPDALASRVKELQAEWARLDKIDGEQAPPSDAGISRRFRALCHHALSPAKAYFEKRRELRGERAQVIEQLLAERLPDEADASALLQRQKALRQGMDQLRDSLPEKRNELAGQIRAELDAISARLGAQREQALLAKRKLIAKLKRDIGASDNEGGIRLAKAAQAEWKQLPRARRQDEDALWKELRELIDPLFEGVRQRQDAEQAERAQLEQDALAILGELEALATAEPERLLHADAHMDNLRQRWRELSRQGQGNAEAGPRGRPAAPLLDERRFDKACAAVERAQAGLKLRREQEQFDAICQAGPRLSEWQAQAPDARPSMTDLMQELKVSAPFRGRLETLLVQTSADQTSTPAALLAVRAELAAELESPEADHPLRRQEQMQRLARKMEGSVQTAPIDEVIDCLIQLQVRTDVSEAERSGLNARIRRAFVQVQGGAATSA